MPIEISEPIVKHLVHDYDIVSRSGMVMPITIDVEAGDSIKYNDLTILIHLASKPSQTDPDRTLPAEDITIFTNQVFSIQSREREITLQTSEQKEAWKNLIHELGATVQ